jgi:MFS superfamily sulfate permease-like transporter
MRNSTRAATYHVIINTLKGLGRTKKDAAFGLVGLFSLYAIRMTCDYLSRRYPRRGLFSLTSPPLVPCLTAATQPGRFSSSRHSAVPL